jgi:hypothetical protein
MQEKSFSLAEKAFTSNIMISLIIRAFLKVLPTVISVFARKQHRLHHLQNGGRSSMSLS